jgi:hypothetical protein
MLDEQKAKVKQEYHRHAPLSMRELDWFRNIVLRVAALLLLRPQLDQAYEKATANAWSVDELFHMGSRH